MPHIIVKLWPGRSEGLKKELADEIARVVADKAKVDLSDVSVAIEEVAREDWREEVYEKDILAKQDMLYKKPEY